MDNSTVMYIAVFAAIVAVIALIMIWQVRSSLNQSAAPAPAPKKAAAPAARAAAPAAGASGRHRWWTSGSSGAAMRPARARCRARDSCKEARWLRGASFCGSCPCGA